jgi:hypothetical protein
VSFLLHGFGLDLIQILSLNLDQFFRRRSEAYESMNNLAGMGGDEFRDNAIDMWKSYLNGIVDKMSNKCKDGKKSLPEVFESGPSGTSATLIPW